MENWGVKEGKIVLSCSDSEDSGIDSIVRCY